MHGDAGHAPNNQSFRLRPSSLRRGDTRPANGLPLPPSNRKQAVMAGRILNRRELRKQSDEAEARETQPASEAEEEEEVDEAGDDDEEDDDEGGAKGDAEDEGGDEEEAKPAKKKAKPKPVAAPKVRKPRKPKAPPRMRARWGVFDAAMKQIAIFDYNQRAAAEQKAAEMVAKKNGSTFFLQIVKEPMPEPAAVEAAAPAAK